MSWLLRYRVRHYVRYSIWFFPLIGMLAALGLVRLMHWLDRMLDWELALHPDAARTVVGTLASAMFTFVVFVCSALLVAVQLASAQLTPRIIAFVFRDPVTRFSLTMFTFAFAFSVAAAVRITTSVPWLTTQVSVYSCVVSLGLFLFLIDHVCRSLRPSGALRAVGSLGRAVIEEVYPRRLTDQRDAAVMDARPLGAPTLTIQVTQSGVVLAFDVQGLVALGRQTDCVFEMLPQVGDFVATGDPLFRIYGDRAALAQAALCRSVAIGVERTLEQDPTFAFRIIVDIASKALSPAINDPTTAVLALDQVHQLLRAVGERHLDDGQAREPAGRLRLIYPTPNWEDFVHLAVTEIRHFGGESIQIARRVHAMLENLIQTLPEQRVALLRQELQMLRRSAERFFPEPEDRALADAGDLQGMGGKEMRSRAGQQAKDEA